MEWIIGIGILWLISVLTDRSGGSGKGTRDTQASERNAPEPKPYKDPTRLPNEQRPLPEKLIDGRRKQQTSSSGVRPPKQSGKVLERNSAGASGNPGTPQRAIPEVDPWQEWEELNVDPAADGQSAGFREVRDFLVGKGVHSLWHMTHVNNVENILRKGVLSHKLAGAESNVIDISEGSVQVRRSRTEPVFGRPMHEYTPLYFNVRNPMLYLRRELTRDLCLLEVSLDIVRDTPTDDFLYTDGNAASRVTRFFSSLDDLDKLPWDVLMAEYWSDFEDGKRKRCAEVLVYPKVIPTHIKRIHCGSERSVRALKGSAKPVLFSNQMFFGR